MNYSLNCKEKLKDWKIIDNNLCEYCNELDDIVHFLIECKIVRSFWQSLINWWNRNFLLKIEKSRIDFRENVLFGFNDNDSLYLSLNYVIMYAKYFIYSNKQFGKEGNIELWKFHIYLLSKLKCELYILKRNDKWKNSDIYESFENIRHTLQP